MPLHTRANAHSVRLFPYDDLPRGTQSLDYSFLLEQLDIASIRELEDLIIDCMYAGLISGKMDQVNRRLRIEGAMGRDLAPGDVESMLGQLEKW